MTTGSAFASAGGACAAFTLTIDELMVLPEQVDVVEAVSPGPFLDQDLSEIKYHMYSEVLTYVRSFRLHFGAPFSLVVCKFSFWV